jgi:DNA-binding transcriptional LysR family regulator
MDRWTEVELFVQVAELGTLTRAAEVMHLSTSAASRHLVALEARLNVRLIQRTTRHLYLTEAGEEFYQRSKLALDQLREAEAVVTGTIQNPVGMLRVSASLSFCILHIAPLLPEFTRRYPNITVDVVAANRYYDLIENGVDVAIRTRQFEADSNITIRRLAETRRILAASPEYLDRHGIPHSPDDLARHKLLIYNLATNPDQLRFQRDQTTTVVQVKGLLQTNDGQILRAAALDSMGILVQPKYIIYDDIAAGRLVPLLDEWDLPRLTINIAFQTRVHLPAKVRLFIDSLVERFRTHNFEQLWTS